MFINKSQSYHPNDFRTARQEAANAEKARAFLAKSTNTALQFANDQLASLIRELHTAEETNFNLKAFQNQIKESFKNTVMTLQFKLKKETETWESLLLSKTNEITGLKDDFVKLNIEKEILQLLNIKYYVLTPFSKEGKSCGERH